ncbi:MAG: hypothetical protein HYY93_03715 [Planctomycetes bacterium]|nr:hypothetical protein [Planctomycetota bacterium]
MRFRPSSLLSVLSLLSLLSLPALVQAQEDELTPEQREKIERMRREEEERARREKGWGDEGPREGPGFEGQPPKTPQPPMLPGAEGKGGPWGGQPPPPMKLSDEQIEELKAFLKEFDPGRLDKFERVSAENPEMARRMLMDAYPEMMKMKEMQKRNPEEYAKMAEERKLDIACMKLAESVRSMKSDDPTRASKLAELKTQLGRLFDQREAAKERQIAKLEEELSRLKETVRKRKTNKDSIVDQRLKEITGEKEDMGW